MFYIFFIFIVNDVFNKIENWQYFYKHLHNKDNSYCYHLSYFSIC